MAKEETPNGIEFEFELGEQSGARYYLMPGTHQNTKAMIKEAKEYLRENFNVVNITVEANIYSKQKGKVS